MMSHLLCNMLLLVFLTAGAVVLVNASNDTIRCGNDNCCQAMGKLMTAVNEINNKEEEATCPVLSEKIDKQAKDLEQMKGKLDRRLASMSALSKQLERLSADLLHHDERLKASDVNEKLDKIATDVRDMHSKQVKDVEELKVKLDRNSADLLQHDERLKANDVCPDVNEKLDKLLSKQVKDVEELKEKLDRSLTSTAAINTQLEKHSADLLRHDQRLKAGDVNKKLDKIATDVRDMHSKQVKDVEELKVNMNRSLSSTSAISLQLEKHSADLLRHDERLKTHDVSQNSIYELVKSIHSFQPKPKDCSDIRDRVYNVSGVYRVDIGNENRKIEADVYCDFRSVGQSWLVLQRRKDGSVNFDRNWTDYANGFGDLTGEFWLGNEKLSLLTTNKKYKLRIELEDFSGEKRWAEYATFSITPSTDKYRLTVAGYSGNAGDSLANPSSNMMFSTKDADNDESSSNCAQRYTGGWWFKACMYSNLNGLYLGDTTTAAVRGVYWYHWKGANYSLKASEMKIIAVK